MIKISDGETTFDCFKREKWENKHGWCETVTSREKSKRWGFFSVSCKYLHADNKPKAISLQKESKFRLKAFRNLSICKILFFLVIKCKICPRYG